MNVFSAKALDVNVPAGGIVQQWDYLDQDSEKWYIAYNPDGTYTINNKLRLGYCLQILVIYPRTGMLSTARSISS